jgi:hypothetical protein
MENDISDEMNFQRWIRKLPWFQEFVQQYGEEPDLNSKDYDYRAAYRAGITPQRNQYDNNRYHWSSEFKSVNHPTYWKELFMKITGSDPDAFGATRESFWNVLDRKP